MNTFYAVKLFSMPDKSVTSRVPIFLAPASGGLGGGGEDNGGECAFLPIAVCPPHPTAPQHPAPTTEGRLYSPTWQGCWVTAPTCAATNVILKQQLVHPFDVSKYTYLIIVIGGFILISQVLVIKS